MLALGIAPAIVKASSLMPLAKAISNPLPGAFELTGFELTGFGLAVPKAQGGIIVTGEYPEALWPGVLKWWQANEIAEAVTFHEFFGVDNGANRTKSRPKNAPEPWQGEARRRYPRRGKG